MSIKRPFELESFDAILHPLTIGDLKNLNLPDDYVIGDGQYHFAKELLEIDEKTKRIAIR